MRQCACGLCLQPILAVDDDVDLSRYFYGRKSALKEGITFSPARAQYWATNSVEVLLYERDEKLPQHDLFVHGVLVHGACRGQ